MEGVSFTTIEEGYIHSFLTVDTSKTKGFKVFKATIPKGSQYFIGTTAEDICSTELIINSEEIVPSELTNNDYETIYETLVEDYIANQEGTAVGHVVTSNSSTPQSVIGNESNVTGIVGLVNDNGKTKVFSSTDETNKQWMVSTAQYKHVMSERITSYEAARNDTTDDKYYKELINNTEVNLDQFPAFKVCKDKGDNWYLPSIGETYRFVRYSTSYFNLIVKYLYYCGNDSVDPIATNKSYWASAEGSSTIAWHVTTDHARVGYWYGKWASSCVRPVFAI